MENLMNQAIAYIFSGILAGIGSWSFIQWKKIEAVQTGLQALLRDNLIRSNREFVKQGYVGIAERDSFENCYRAYKGLGADGVIDDIVAQVRALPLEVNNGITEKE